MSTSTGGNTAVIYLRQSLDRSGEGVAVERQEKECREHAERLGLVVVDVLTDNDVSATKGKRRPGFEQLLASKPDAVVVWHIDRLVRLTRDLERVIDLGVPVYAVTAGHVDLSTPAGRAVARTITAWATYEGEQKALRQKAANRQRAAAGKPKWSARPFGFNLDGTHVEVEAEALRRAYAGVLSGRSLLALADELNAAELRTTFGRPWTGTTLRPVLTNPRMIAVRVHQGEEVGPATWEPIVDEVTFRTASRVLKGRGVSHSGWSRSRVGMLTGIASCGTCGGTVIATWRGKKGTPGARQMYRCKANHVTVPMGMVDAVVRAVVATRLVQEDAAHLWDEADETPALEQRVAELRREVDGLADDYATGALPRAAFVAASARLADELEKAEAALGALGNGKAPSDLLSLPTPAAVDARLMARDPRERGAIVTTVVDAVTIHSAGKGRKWKPELVDVWVRGLFGMPPALVVLGQDVGDVGCP